MQNKVAIIFGMSGQIGSYLAEYLLGEKFAEYKYVIGVSRRTSTNNVWHSWRIEHILSNPQLKMVAGDITDMASLCRIFNDIIINKDITYEVYSLAAQSYVAYSFSNPGSTFDITGTGHMKILETLLPYHDKGFKVRTYFASSSEIMGRSVDSDGFQSIDTKFCPQSPYGVAKLAAYHMHRIYRESYGMFNVSGIVFNTESPRRGEEFVTRKITKWFGRTLAGGMIKEKLKLGNITASRDWTHAKDTVKAIYLILNNQRPKDYCVASGETHTIRNFLEECFELSKGHALFWGKNTQLQLDDFFEINEQFIRPNEVQYLKGNADPIRTELGWKPTIGFKELVAEMLEADFTKELTRYPI